MITDVKISVYHLASHIYIPFIL